MEKCVNKPYFEEIEIPVPFGHVSGWYFFFFYLYIFNTMEYIFININI